MDAGALEGSDLQRRAAVHAERSQVRPRRLNLRENDVGVTQQHSPGGGQASRPTALRAFQQALAHDPLQRRELLADRRLGIAQPYSGGAKSSLFSNFPQRNKMTKLQRIPPLGV